MAKLKDLVQLDGGNHHITIQDVEIPIAFNMKTLEYVADAFGDSFTDFETELNSMMSKKKVILGKKELKLINSLLYGVVRSGGTETTPDELANYIQFDEVEGVYGQVMKLFNESYFQPEDAKKLKGATKKK